MFCILAFRCKELGVCNSLTPPCVDCPNLKGEYMYLVVWVALGVNNEPRDLWVAHESLEDARTHYNALIALDEVYTVSICAVIESTDYTPTEVI